MIKNGTSYFIYDDGQGISGLTSTDLRNWSATSSVFPSASPLAWTTNNIAGFTGYFWAPDIAYFNGQYYLYYVASEWGTINSAIGLVASPSLTSPVWTDQGKVIEFNYPATANNTNRLLAQAESLDNYYSQTTNADLYSVHAFFPAEQDF